MRKKKEGEENTGRKSERVEKAHIYRKREGERERKRIAPTLGRGVRVCKVKETLVVGKVLRLVDGLKVPAQLPRPPHQDSTLPRAVGVSHDPIHSLGRKVMIA